MGIAGSDEKCAWLVDELGFDAAINYRTDNVGKAIRAACPKGVDVFFDNVGGDILEAGIANLALRGRIVLCGAIATYNDDAPAPGLRTTCRCSSRKRGRMEGFIILDYMSRANEAIGELAGWVMGGDLKFAVDVVDGLDNAPGRTRPPVHRRQPGQGDGPPVTGGGWRLVRWRSPRASTVAWPSATVSRSMSTDPAGVAGDEFGPGPGHEAGAGEPGRHRAAEQPVGAVSGMQFARLPRAGRDRRTARRCPAPASGPSSTRPPRRRRGAGRTRRIGSPP